MRRRSPVDLIAARPRSFLRNAVVLFACGGALCAGCLGERSPPGKRRVALTADAAASSCGQISYIGCCAGQTLIYCVEGELQVEPCAPRTSCAWSTTHGLYHCGPGSLVDPAGLAPRDCPLVDAGADGPLEDAARPLDGNAEEGSPPATPCGALTYVGCCAGDQLLFCSGGEVLSSTCSPGTCGWNDSAQYYACDTTGQSGPLSHPQSCSEVLGDGGLPDRDGGGDAITEMGTTEDAGVDLLGIVDASGEKDGFIIGGDEVPTRDALPADAAPRDLRGLDAIGLDSAQVMDAGVGDEAAGCACRASDKEAEAAAIIAFLLLCSVCCARARGAISRRRR